MRRAGTLLLRRVGLGPCLLLAAWLGGGLAVGATPAPAGGTALTPVGGSPALELVLRRYPAGAELLAVPLPEDGAFGLRFLHSVERTSVTEYLRVTHRGTGDAGAFVLERTEYASVGAGLSPEGELVAGPDGRPLLVEWVGRPLPDLVVRVMPLTRNELLVGERVLCLYEMVEDGAAIEFTVRPHPDGPEGSLAEPREGP